MEHDYITDVFFPWKHGLETQVKVSFGTATPGGPNVDYFRQEPQLKVAPNITKGLFVD